MAKQVNGPQNKEQLNLMIDVVKREVNLAQDLLNSYQEDLAQLELNSSISEKEKESKRLFLETAIKESKELLSIRRKQLKAIGIDRSGRAAKDARIKTWKDKSLESKGMNAIISEMDEASKEQKHNATVEKIRQERQARSEAVRNAATTIATPATKLADEKGKESFEIKLDLEEKFPRPDYIVGSDKWKITNVSEDGIIKYEDDKGNAYEYNPKIDNVTKSFYDNGRFNFEVYNSISQNWQDIPDEILLSEKKLYFDQVKQQWLSLEPEREEFDSSPWLVPTYDNNGNLMLDEKGNMKLTPVSEKEYEEVLNNGGRTEAERAKFARRIKSVVLEQEDKNKGVNPKDIGEIALEDQKAELGKWGPNRADVILQNPNVQKQMHLNWFQKLKLWFMRLFNKNYQLPEARNNEFYLSDDIRKYKEDAIQESNEFTEKVKEEKREIKGFSKPKVKQFFKDHKNKILALSAVAVASLALVFGINAQKEHNRQIIEQKAAEAQREAELEAKREQEEQQALEEAAKEQQNQQENEQDKLVAHDGTILTSGSVEKQYFAHEGLEYTADSTGRGSRGILPQDTIVEIFNRAIVRENEDGTKEILLTSNGKTWEDYAKDSGMSIDEIKNMLKQDKTYEANAIQVSGTNHNIFNTYGWVKASELEESSRGTENLKDFEITTGDNTEILQQLQQNERANQNQEAER